jgi:peptide/nickel transport system ATP-binding protein
MKADPLLLVDDLKTAFFTKSGIVNAVDGVSFQVRAGQILGLVGESGSGKSITGYSIMGLIDPPGKICGGRILFKGTDLAGLSPREMRRLRGSRISMIFQDPMMTLNPLMQIGTQITEAIKAHARVSDRVCRDRAVEALSLVGIPSAAERLAAYPHQFSGGMRQRVAIAIALINDPELVIADEPTTALDVTVQSQILRNVQELCRERGTALIWITHDLSIVSGLADDICVMYAGQIVESGPVREVIGAPRHPYTLGLIGAVPSRNRRGEPLREVPGMMPPPTLVRSQCSFAPRCDRVQPNCLSSPIPMLSDDPARHFRCLHPVAGVYA